MFYDNVLKTTISSANTLKGRWHLPGIISEVHRCFYYSDGQALADVNAEKIARIAGFESRLAVDGFQSWMCSYPKQCNVDILDILYWEHRLGVWSSISLTCREALSDFLPPMNCREYLELGLSVDVAARRKPHSLLREMISSVDPELDDIPYNWDYWRAIQEFAEFIPMPWRIKKRLKLV